MGQYCRCFLLTFDWVMFKCVHKKLLAISNTQFKAFTALTVADRPSEVVIPGWIFSAVDRSVAVRAEVGCTREWLVFTSTGTVHQQTKIAIVQTGNIHTVTL